MRESHTRPLRRRYMPSITTGSLIALVLGLGLGTLAFRLQSGALQGVIPVLEPIGGVWINALRMTVIPLVVSQLVVAVLANREELGVGRLAIRACVILLVLLAAAATFTAVVSPGILSRISFDQTTVEWFRTTALSNADLTREATASAPGARDWLLGLVPSNVFKAAADGEMLPLILFTILFALAIRQISTEHRRSLESLFRGFAEATLVLIRWVLVLTPIGVFALTYVLAAGSGLGAARTLLYFVLLVSGLLIAFTLFLYAIATLLGRVPLKRFAWALLPAQVVGVSTRSSLASLPALMEGAEERLGMSTSISGFALPFAVSTFRLNMMISSTFTCLFLARLYGIPLGPLDILTYVVILLPITISVPGIPTHLGLTSLPAYLSVGIPIEGVVILHTVDAIPDIFKTLINVTGDMTAATVLARFAGQPVSEPAPTVASGLAVQSAGAETAVDEALSIGR